MTILLVTIITPAGSQRQLYQDHPYLFFHRRAVALAPFLSFAVNRPNRDYLKLDWFDEGFTRDWGRANKVSREDFLRKMAHALDTTPEEIKRRPVPSILVSLKKFICKSVWYACGQALDKIAKV